MMTSPNSSSKTCRDQVGYSSSSFTLLEAGITSVKAEVITSDNDSWKSVRHLDSDELDALGITTPTLEVK